MIVEFSLDELIHMPTLLDGIDDELKFTQNGYRVWLAKRDDMVTVEQKIAGRWVIVRKYEAM